MGVRWQTVCLSDHVHRVHALNPALAEVRGPSLVLSALIGVPYLHARQLRTAGRRPPLALRTSRTRGGRFFVLVDEEEEIKKEKENVVRRIARTFVRSIAYLSELRRIDAKKKNQKRTSRFSERAEPIADQERQGRQRGRDHRQRCLHRGWHHQVSTFQRIPASRNWRFTGANASSMYEISRHEREIVVESSAEANRRTARVSFSRR